MSLTLNKVDFIGGIFPHTPTCIIESILQTHRVTKITDVSTYTIVDMNQFSTTDLQRIALYVNPDHTLLWKASQLITALNHLNTNPDSIDLDKVTKVKSLEPTSVDSYDMFMMYRLCRWYKINTSAVMTAEQMCQALKLLKTSPHDLLTYVTERLQHLSQANLINIVLSTDITTSTTPNLRVNNKVRITTLAKEETERKEEKHERVSLDTLKSSYKSITDINTHIMLMKPRSDAEAIMLAAIVFGVDITSSKCPSTEYKTMKRGYIKQYVPVDENFRIKYQRNPQWFDIKKTWCPHIPNIYNAKDLDKFLKAECLEVESVNSPPIWQRLLSIREEQKDKTGAIEERLKYSRIISNFYLGYHPEATTKESLILAEDLSGVDPELLITYGVSDTGPLRVYTLNDLIEIFTDRKILTDPINPADLITKSSVRKLKLICQSKSQVNPINKVQSEYRKLYQVISLIESQSVPINQSANELIQHYKTEPINVEKLLHLLLEAGMYMRGWKVDKLDKYPVKNAQFHPKFQEQVDNNVCQAVARYREHITQLPPALKRTAENLQLLLARINGDEISYNQPTDNGDGNTVNQRLAKVVAVEEHQKICIRLSSNYICSTAHYYHIKVIKTPPPFNIRDLKMIS